nr:uncharacterized protein LOC102456013 [Pelodiscus sinensis]|eukprot:XP_025036292.1 uncharacterized protein LOC102456013 [Pelodiscus sinensis]
MNRFKASRFRHAAVKPARKEAWIRDVRAGASTSCGNHLKSSCRLIAFSADSAGVLGIVPLESGDGGKRAVSQLCCHSDAVTDFDFSPFDALLLATGSADQTVSVEETGLGVCVSAQPGEAALGSRPGCPFRRAGPGLAPFWLSEGPGNVGRSCSEGGARPSGLQEGRSPAFRAVPGPAALLRQLGQSLLYTFWGRKGALKGKGWDCTRGTGHPTLALPGGPKSRRLAEPLLPASCALEPHGDLIQSTAWKQDGSLLGTASKVSAAGGRGTRGDFLVGAPGPGPTV